jgi:hypothetical protein
MLAEVQALGRREHTVLNDDVLEFALTDEERIVEALRKHGYTIRRDDDLERGAMDSGH